MYPVGLHIADKLCVVVGGGKVAERKVIALLIEKARVCLVSPKATPALAALVDSNNKCKWYKKKYEQGDLDGAFLVFAATDSPEVQERIYRDAKQLGLLINVIDAPRRCTFHVPAVVRQGDLTLAVFTHGNSPAVAAMIRHQLEELYGVEYAYLLELMGTLRSVVMEACDTAEERKKMFADLLHVDLISWISDARWDLVRQHIEMVVGVDINLNP